jgi:peptidyl-tRNA hydrolase
MKLYVLVRDDLPSTSYKGVQAGHAVAQFIFDNKYRGYKNFWKNDHLIYLRVSSEEKLIQIYKELEEEGYAQLSMFKEPDLNNSVTAIAVSGPGLTYVLRDYKLL